MLGTRKTILLAVCFVALSSFTKADAPPEPEGLDFDIAPDVPQNEIDLIKQGLVIAQTFLDESLGGDIEASIRDDIVVKIVATGDGNQEPGGFGSCCTGLNQDGIRPFFDVANNGYPSTDIRKIGTAIHEYVHGWYASLGCHGLYEQPLGNWLNEGLAEWVRRKALVNEGLATDQDELTTAEDFAFGDGSMEVPLRFLAVTRTGGIWAGNIGHVAVDHLISESPMGYLSARDICENIDLGQSVPEAFLNAFGVELESFYKEFEDSKTLPPQSWIDRTQIFPDSDDIDGDGHANDVDNCPGTANYSQKNFDGDEFGNACDPDIDNDGTLDEDDAFVFVTEWQYDTDCDNEGNANDWDDDNDGIDDESDSTPLGENGVPDFDQDGRGDDCDPDDDNDESPDYEEIEAGTNLLDPDSDGDGVMDGLDEAPGSPSNLCSDLGPDVVFQNTAISSGDSRTCAATGSIEVADTVSIASGGSARLISPKVTLRPGLALPAGAELTVESRSPLP